MGYCEDGEYYEEPEYEIENIKREEGEKDTLELKCDLKYLKEQIVNEIKYKVKDMVVTEIKAEIKEEIITDNFKEILRDSIQELVTQEALKIFDEGITITNSWGEEKETKTFRELVKEQTKEVLEDRNYYSKECYKDKFKKELQRTIEREIESIMEKTTKETKSQIQEVFNEATQKQLSDTMFDLLMQNETYQKLNNSIKLLGK